MDFTFTTVYEDGVLRALEPLPPGLFEEGEHVTLVFDEEKNTAMLYRLPKPTKEGEDAEVSVERVGGIEE